MEMGIVLISKWCLSTCVQFVTGAGGLLLVPFGVAVVLGAPVLGLQGRLRCGLTAVANVGDLLVSCNREHGCGLTAVATVGGLLVTLC